MIKFFYNRAFETGEILQELVWRAEITKTSDNFYRILKEDERKWNT